MKGNSPRTRRLRASRTQAAPDSSRTQRCRRHASFPATKLCSGAGSETMKVLRILPCCARMAPQVGQQARVEGDDMKLIMTHGYMLSDTGSNVYVQNLCRALVRKGNEVFLLCQEPAPLSYEFVGEFGVVD